MEEGAGVALYALQQTILYKAPPVVRGRVPKNAYGNLDIYAPTMVPAGGSHILNPETARAARALGIDYSDAVTGFSFKGRYGTAVINGAVVATEFREAVQEVLHAFEHELADEEAHRRSAEALRVWKRLLTGLRIRERINGYEIEGERKVLDEKIGAVDEAGKENEEDESDGGGGGGGFFPDGTAQAIAEPTAGQFGDYSGTDEGVDSGPGGFLTEDNLDDIEDQSHDVGGPFANDDDSRYNLQNFNKVEEGRPIPENSPPEYQPTYENHNEVEEGRYLDEEQLDQQQPTQHPSQTAGDLADGHIHDPEEPQRQEHVPTTQETKTPSPSITQDQKKPASSSSQPLEQKQIPTTNSYSAVPSHSNTTAPKGHFADLNLSECQLAEARMLQEMHEASQKKPLIIVSSQAEMQTIPLPQSMLLHGGSADALPIIPRREDEEKEKMVILNDHGDEGSDGESSSSSDAGSLLSHDPEDEDADPEWIA